MGRNFGLGGQDLIEISGFGSSEHFEDLAMFHIRCSIFHFRDFLHASMFLMLGRLALHGPQFLHFACISILFVLLFFRAFYSGCWEGRHGRPLPPCMYALMGKAAGNLRSHGKAPHGQPLPAFAPRGFPG